MKSLKCIIGLLLFYFSFQLLHAEIKITHGPVIGRPGATSMGIWARTNVPGSFRVKYGQAPERLEMISEPVVTTLARDNTGWILIKDLKPDTHYFYQVFTADDSGRIDLAGSFRTLPESSAYKNSSTNPRGLFNFKFEFACGNREGPKCPDKGPVYQTMVDRLQNEVNFAILNGDWLYEMDRGYKVEEWLEQVKQSPSRIPRIVRIVPHIVGAWQNYKDYYDLCEPLRVWHRNVPSFFVVDDHEILDDCRGAGSIGNRTRIAVYRDIGIQAWYDYLGWSDPVGFKQGIVFGMGSFTKGSNVLVDKNTDFLKINMEEINNLHVHWGDDYAWRHLKRYDGKGGVPNAGVYEIKKVLDSHRLLIYPSAKETAHNAYSIGRLNYFTWRLANCEFFFLDTRSQRQMPITAEPDKLGQSLLGNQQKAWLKEKMRHSDADFLFVISSVNLFIPHIVDAGEKGPDSWKGNQEDSWSGFPHERSEMIAFWKSLGKPVLVLTGDLHNSFVCKSGENLWEFAAGPHSSPNARAESEGGRPANGPWEYRGEKFDIRWSTYQKRNDSYNQKVYCVVQVNNVVANKGKKDKKIQWIAYPQPSVTVQYYDGLTGKLLYAESLLAKLRK